VIALQWPAYANCPSGYSLSGYTFTVSGPGTLDNANPSGAAQNGNLTLTGEGQVQISYVANCGELTSSASAPVTVTATAAEEPGGPGNGNGPGNGGGGPGNGG
jgi:eukaryotic-like serine/threonine-protein kinase